MITFKKGGIRVNKVKLNFLPWEEARDRTIYYNSDNNIFCIYVNYGLLLIIMQITKESIDYNFRERPSFNAHFSINGDESELGVYAMSENGYNKACKKIENEWNKLVSSFINATVVTDHAVNNIE